MGLYITISTVVYMSQMLISNFTVSGGFAIVQPDSVLSINAVEGFPLEEFSAEVRRPISYNLQAVRSQITEAQKIAGGSGSAQDIAEAQIELEVPNCGNTYHT